MSSDLPSDPVPTGESGCPHCEERPASPVHRCPVDLEPDGCRCCDACRQTCADLAWHRNALDAATMVNPGAGEVEIAYWAGVWDGPAGPEPEARS